MPLFEDHELEILVRLLAHHCVTSPDDPVIGAQVFKLYEKLFRMMPSAEAKGPYRKAAVHSYGNRPMVRIEA